MFINILKVKDYISETNQIFSNMKVSNKPSYLLETLHTHARARSCDKDISSYTLSFALSVFFPFCYIQACGCKKNKTGKKI